MVDLTGGFKSFVDKAQQKITEIQNDERLRETVGGAIKQAQGKIEEIKNDDRVKNLMEQGKEKIDELRSGSHKPIQAGGETLALSGEDCGDSTVDWFCRKYFLVTNAEYPPYCLRRSHQRFLQ
jgi:hypothetical protein